MKTGDLVQISSDIQDKLCGRLGILIEDAGPPMDEIVVSSDDLEFPRLSDERYFNVYVDGRCYLYGDYELLLISSSGN